MLWSKEQIEWLVQGGMYALIDGKLVRRIRGGKYSDTQYEVFMGRALSLATAADVGDVWGAGNVRHIIRAVMLIFTTAVDATGVLKIDKRPTAGSNTGRGDGDIAVINYTTVTGAQGKGVFKEGLNVQMNATEEAVAQVTDATPTAGNAHVILLVEPAWERPANNTDLVATT